MALKKLPCEYKELGLARIKYCFGSLSDSEKESLLKAFQKCSDNFEKIKYDK
ncbi:MAG TPA: hypothetical protein VGB37_14695 [Candidatus Lokiarchaeia archaeon]